MEKAGGSLQFLRGIMGPGSFGDRKGIWPVKMGDGGGGH